MKDDKDETSVPDDNENKNCYTSQFKFRQFKLTWIIEDFNLVCKTMKVIESPKFPSTSTEEVKWYLRFEPVELKDGNEEEFRIFLRHTHLIEKNLKVNFSIKNLSKIGPRFHENLMSFPPNDLRSWSKTGANFYKELKWDKTDIKTVKVKCSLSVLDSINDVISKPISQKNDNLLNQLKDFQDDETFKDVIFKVKDKEFSAHKIILILRSPVFASMFKKKMTEENASIIEIKDIEPAIFEEMLYFIYTDDVHDLEESANGLYYAADKYQLENLKNLCLNSLYKNLSAKSIIRTLQLSEMLNIFDLKRRCLNYLVSNLDVLKKKSEYEELLKSYPHLSTEILKMQKAINHEIVDNVKYSEKTIFEFK